MSGRGPRPHERRRPRPRGEKRPLERSVICLFEKGKGEVCEKKLFADAEAEKRNSEKSTENLSHPGTRGLATKNWDPGN